ncbi:MAG: SsrA-binding protein [Candidatus Pelagibacter sp.]|nr:SsrA-binding protein [Candidatus Pelagibacter sp.]OUV86564.1 MAG: SsrA-binding protein [Pelagibacteraceae bacterium TMED136]|tara:strand:+ start:873 stop:1343 length:471 start_codon:yes stop_codon:yes gene_type:complete
MNKKKVTSKIVAQNRKASFNYFFEDTIEAGIELLGSEVKSLRAGKGSIIDSYALDSESEIYLHNTYIPEYKHSSYNNHDPRRLRKLLLNKKEINKIIGKINRDGFTVVPTRVYFNSKGIAKVNIAIGKGKKLHDKRQTKKQRDWNREKSRLFRKQS